MDVDDDVYDDDEGRCFKSKPAALRHAAHIFFVLLLLVLVVVFFCFNAPFCA